jgi:hypothetical protein
MSGAALEAPAANKQEDVKPLQNGDAPANIQVLTRCTFSHALSKHLSETALSQNTSPLALLHGRVALFIKGCPYEQNVMTRYAQNGSPTVTSHLSCGLSERFLAFDSGIKEGAIMYKARGTRASRPKAP